MARKSKRTAKQTYVLQIVWGVLAIVVVVGLCFGVYKATRQPEQQITTITVSGEVTVPETQLVELVGSVLDGTYVGLIPKRFKQMFPTESVRKLLLTVPQIRNVEVTRDNQTVHVSVEEYLPYAMWCEEDLDYCVLIDETGYAFMEAPQLSGTTMLRFIVEDSLVLPNRTVLEPHFLEKALAFAELLDVNFGFAVANVRVRVTGDIYYELIGGASLYAASSISNQETLENLSTVLNSRDFAHLQADTFNYIDLRFGNRIYVNEERGSVGTLASTSSSTAAGVASTDELAEDTEAAQENATATTTDEVTE